MLLADPDQRSPQEEPQPDKIDSGGLPDGESPWPPRL